MATPESKAREIIDRKLADAGYLVQDMRELDPRASLGVVVREYPTESGPVDYLIFIDKNPVGVIEAKADDKGGILLSVSEQAKKYIESGLKYVNATINMRFSYVATSIRTCFCDYGDDARTREVFSFHRPETLAALLKDTSTLRNRMKIFPSFDNHGFRNCQTKAIKNLDISFGENRSRALIQMATGAGKTFTAITAVYRLLKFAKAKRILFLVDTKNLGEQAEQEFRAYKPNDDSRLFSELYNVSRLSLSTIPVEANVCICTIQRMYSILRGEDLDDSAERDSLNEQFIIGNPREVVYNSKYPLEFFDFIVIDECHRSIYNIWKQVLDYFDAFLIGLTATPDKRTFGFFNENIVSEYTHEQAVLDGVNVGRQGTYLIDTELSQKGNTILKQSIEVRERLSRKKRWEQLDEDLTYKPTDLNEKVVAESQIRNIIRAFKQSVLTEMFPGRREIPKTLVFAKTDSHADDIIRVIREEFCEKDEFCKKITYSVNNPKGILTEFRNQYNPRIAVTVDMIATGTDVKPIECLIFMRDVRSKNYFEQMLGRATRTQSMDELRNVTPSAREAKTGFIVVDAVGVTKSLKTISCQLECKPTVSLENLMMSVALGAKDEATITSLANRFITLDKVLNEKEKMKITSITDGVTLIDIVRNMLDSFDPDIIADQVRRKFELDIDQEPTETQKKTVCEELIDNAVVPISGSKFRDFILDARKIHDQIMDPTIDTVIYTGWDQTNLEETEKRISSFRQFIDIHKDEIVALSIIYSKNYKARQLTYSMIEDLYEAMCKAGFNKEQLWRDYSVKYSDKTVKRVEIKLADIVSMVRFELGHTTKLDLFSAEVAIKFQQWVFNKQSGPIKFTSEQMEWLHMIRDHIATSIYIEKDNLDLAPFDKKGGLARYYALFKTDYLTILDEMNYALAA
jgi:type I restriction enzyme R subunit